jgi:hypothetical protein
LPWLDRWFRDNEPNGGGIGAANARGE